MTLFNVKCQLFVIYPSQCHMLPPPTKNMTPGQICLRYFFEICHLRHQMWAMFEIMISPDHVFYYNHMNRDCEVH